MRHVARPRATDHNRCDNPEDGAIAGGGQRPNTHGIEGLVRATWWDRRGRGQRDVGRQLSLRRCNDATALVEQERGEWIPTREEALQRGRRSDAVAPRDHPCVGRGDETRNRWVARDIAHRRAAIGDRHLDRSPNLTGRVHEPVANDRLGSPHECEVRERKERCEPGREDGGHEQRELPLQGKRASDPTGFGSPAGRSCVR
jgi:hypothetical protein